MDTEEMMNRTKEVFGTRIQHLGQQILTLSMTGQPCDITFVKKKPVINVKIDQQITLRSSSDRNSGREVGKASKWKRGSDVLSSIE